MTCEHLSWSFGDTAPGCTVCICNRCGNIVDVGPATITPEVEIEIRAAELATDVKTDFRRGEIDGMYIDCDRPQCTTCLGLLEHISGWQAGYLAAAILDEEG